MKVDSLTDHDHSEENGRVLANLAFETRKMCSEFMHLE